MRAVLALLFVLSCTTAPAPKDLEVSNQTALAVTLVVNGTAVRTFPPGTVGAVAAGALPPLPWSVEARSPTGRVLTSMTVRRGDVVESGGTYRGAGMRVDLSCGRLDVWSGPPMAGPVPGAGTRGDCEP